MSWLLLRTFEKISEGCGYWGCGTFSLGVGNSFVGVFNKRADAIFVATLRKWRDQLARKAAKVSD